MSVPEARTEDPVPSVLVAQPEPPVPEVPPVLPELTEPPEQQVPPELRVVKDRPEPTVSQALAVLLAQPARLVRAVHPDRLVHQALAVPRVLLGLPGRLARAARQAETSPARRDTSESR
jgi:hypothetical protein